MEVQDRGYKMEGIEWRLQDGGHGGGRREVDVPVARSLNRSRGRGSGSHKGRVMD